MSDDALRRRQAVRVLILCTVLWGVSFATMKALVLAQRPLVPAASDSWFFSSLCIVYRFGIAALVMWLVALPTLRQITRLEFAQGLGLGFFGGAGILLQMDGLSHTSASTSAFLTQCYCVTVPLWVALRERRRPSNVVLAACGLVMLGVFVLSEIDLRQLRLGRGELETILASLLFTGQILWLEIPRYAANNPTRFSAVMFTVISLVCAPIAAFTAPVAADWLRAYQTGPTVGLLGILVVICTLGAYVLMNRWQRFVPATHAGLIYCLEPVFASAMALVLPGWFSRWAGIDYANERLTMSLLLGGALISLANVLVQWPRREKTAGTIRADKPSLETRGIVSHGKPAE